MYIRQIIANRFAIASTGTIYFYISVSLLSDTKC